MAAEVQNDTKSSRLYKKPFVKKLIYFETVLKLIYYDLYYEYDLKVNYVAQCIEWLEVFCTSRFRHYWLHKKNT